MRDVNRTTICLLGWFLLLHSSAVFGSDLFQWTDAKGVLHFTDDLSAVPEIVRESSYFTVRRDFFSPPATSGGKQSVAEPLPLVKPEMAGTAELNFKQSAEANPTDSPEEVTIVVVNSIVQKPTKKSCPDEASCKTGVRPVLDHRRHGQAVVLSGRRQHIHR